jgi:uncharacterized caspase-like protein
MKIKNADITHCAKKAVICLCVLFPFFSSARDNGQLYSVCVGVSEYAEPSDNLTYPDKDAVEMYELLKLHTAPSNLILLTDSQATADNVLKRLDELFTQTRPEDIVIFFFSGHGGQGCFCAHDRIIYFKSLQEIFKKTKSRRKIIFADACYAGTLRGPAKPENGSDSHAGKDVLLFLSSRSGQVSFDSPSLKNGIFSRFLIAGLKGAADVNRDRIIAAKELFAYVNAKVLEHSQNRQTPVMWGKFDDRMPILNWNRQPAGKQAR